MSPAGILLLLLAALGVAVVGAVQWGLGAATNREMAVRTGAGDPGEPGPTAAERLDRWLRRTRLGARLEGQLLAAGVRLTVVQLVGLIVAGALVGWLVVTTTLAPLLGLPALVLGGYAPLAWLRRRRGQRLEVFIGQLPELARVLSNAASAGLALRTAVEMAADELQDPAATEMRRCTDAMRVGRTLEDGLRDMERRLPSRELAVLVSTLVISSRAGGQVVTALRNISATLEARKELRREVKTQLAQAVFTSYAVLAMGVGVLFLLNTVSPGLLGVMTHKTIGQAALAIGASLFAVGFVLVRRLARIET